MFLYQTTQAHSCYVHEINMITYTSLLLWQCHVACLFWSRQFRSHNRYEMYLFLFLFNETFSSCDYGALNVILMTKELYTYDLGGNALYTV
jgi:hypothetical protein